MISIRHIGFYVDDILRLEAFYSSVFSLISICSMEEDRGALFDDLYKLSGSEVLTTKMITPYGRHKGQGDMLELVKLVSNPDDNDIDNNYPIYRKGVGHIAFEVDDIDKTIELVIQYGGSGETKVYKRENGNKCCFCRDPEGNWIELIERAKNA